MQLGEQFKTLERAGLTRLQKDLKNYFIVAAAETIFKCLCAGVYYNGLSALRAMPLCASGIISLYFNVEIIIALNEPKFVKEYKRRPDYYSSLNLLAIFVSYVPLIVYSILIICACCLICAVIQNEQLRK